MPTLSADFTAPDIDWVVLTPLLILFGAGIVGVLLEAFLPQGKRRVPQIVLAMLAVLVSFIVVFQQAFTWYVGEENPAVRKAFGISYVVGPYVMAVQLVLLFCAFLALLVIADRTRSRIDAFAPSAAATPGSKYEELAIRRGLEQTEVYPLLLFAVAGMMIFPATQEYITLFVALEVFSLPLYVMAGMARRRRLLSQEASFKYFVLGAFASAIFLFGVALLYGFSGDISYGGTQQALMQGSEHVFENGEYLGTFGIVMVVIGLLFKLGAAPFHAWTPDVYQGAPTPVTGFMAACTKIAAYGALTMIAVQVVGPVDSPVSTALSNILFVIAIVTMLLGSIVGLAQTNVKRMLAYSSIAHAGFLIVAIVSGVYGILPGLFYLLVYGVATIGAFAVITLVRTQGKDGEDLGEATEIGQWAGLGRQSPLLAGSMAIFLLSFAGIPMTAGFIAKFLTFEAAIKADFTWLAIAGIISSVIAAFFYIRLLVIMFFVKPIVVDSGDAIAEETELEREVAAASESNPARVSMLTVKSSPIVTATNGEGLGLIVIVVAAVVTVIAGVYPQPFLDIFSNLLNY